MDWSAVYEDVGEEDGDWEREEINSTRTGMLQALQLEGNYGPFICYAFTVNYILGVGCLGIPYAFLQCGIVLGSILVIVLSIVSYMTVMWVAQTFQQELLMNSYLSNSNPFILSPVIKRKSPIPPGLSSSSVDETQPILPQSLKNNLYSSLSNFGAVLQNTTEQQEAKKLMLAEQGKDFIEKKRKERKQSQSRDLKDSAVLDKDGHVHQLEVTDLAYEYLGSYGKLAYQASLMMLTYVGLLAYSQVFNSSFISQIWPGCSLYVPSLLFGLVVVPLSCFDLADQVTVQVLMSLLRFLSLGILLFGTIIAYYVDPPASSANLSAHPASASASGPGPTPLFELSGFSVMFTTAIFSQLFQHSVPGLISPLSPEHKKHVPTIFRCALATTSLIYIATGCMCVIYFGGDLQQSVNLNFVDFTWGVGDNDDDPYSTKRVLISIVSMIVVLFPALDTLSVFPLIANTLGNNLNSAFPGMSGLVRHSGWVKEHGYVRRVTLIMWRLVAAIPPIVASVFVSDLIFSLQVAGLCGIVVALVTPALLQRQCEFRGALIPTSMRANSPIPNEFSSKFFSTGVLSLAALALAIAFYQMLYP